MGTIVTLQDVKDGIEHTDEYINTMVREKYARDNEKTLQDIRNRLVRMIEKQAGTEYHTYNVSDLTHLLATGKFIPGGSVLAGLHEGTDKRSLSNCYILPIKEDSIEAIVDCIKEACRVYSYRGGVGIDISILRPNGHKVNNAAITSSGSVSFIPMLAQANSTIGTNGRRAAMMISESVLHRDIFEFIWCKADPERVFIRDNLSQDNTASSLVAYLNSKKEGISQEIKRELSALTGGKLPELNTVNISVKLTDRFMEEVLSGSTVPWKTYFPDVEASGEEFYKEHWDGDFDKWTSIGGKLVEYNTHFATITQNNRENFIGRMVVHGEDKQLKILTVPLIDTLLEESGTYRGEFLNPSPKEILRDIAKCTHKRGDPGVLFWDKQLTWSNFPILHEKLKPITTNPCGEIAGYPYASCNLGAMVLTEYVGNPWTPEAFFDMDTFLRDCESATVLMNIIRDINENMHPLQEQRDMDAFSRRIGIEFTGLADACSMCGYRIDSQEALDLVGQIVDNKAYVETVTSIYLAKVAGACPAAGPDNPQGVMDLRNSPYYERIVNMPKHKLLHTPKFLKSDVVPDDIISYGIYNAGLNTVGPTGSISTLAGNCSSGVEPMYSIRQIRFTRVGTRGQYFLWNKNVALQLLKEHERDGTTSWDLDDVKNRLNIIEAKDIDSASRVALQARIQLSTDSSISSTINLSNDVTVEQILQIYKDSYLAGLKGVTMYRDGSLQGVILDADAKSESTSTEVVCSGDLKRGEIMTLPDKLESFRHIVMWNGTSIYLSVGVVDGKPVEVWVASLPKEVAMPDGNYSEEDYQTKLSLWNAITRLVSVGLRGGIDIANYTKQLRKSSYVVNDLISTIARVLEQYVDTSNKQDDSYATCPKCKEKSLMPYGGCMTCTSCGYSKCE